MRRLIIEVESGIVLRQYIVEDAEAIFQLIDESRKHLSQFGDRTAKKYPTIESVRDSIIHPKDARKIRFGIWDHGVFVGSINILPYIDFQGDDAAEIGFWLGDCYQGRGYMRKSIRKVIKYAFDVVGACRIYGIVAKENSRSARVFESVGCEKFDAITELQFYLKRENYKC